MCALRNPVYLGNTLDDSRVHEIEQEIGVSGCLFCLASLLEIISE